MRRTVILTTAGLITLAAWCCLGLSLAGGLGPGVGAGPHEASGRLMAEQALALLAPGGQITVIARDTTTFKNPASDLQLASFRKIISSAKAAIRSVDALQVDPLRPVEVPSGDFCELIGHTAKGSVIVSFMGPPMLTPAERARLGEIKPSIVAFCSGQNLSSVDLRLLFDEGLLRAAVLDRRGTDWTDQSLLAVTAANLGDLSPGRGGGK
jgi:hypothetical protein